MSKGIYRRYDLAGNLVTERVFDVVRYPAVKRDWPAALVPLKALAKEGDRGAGDIIARVIGPIGGYAFKVWYRKLFGKDCGCGHRQEVLNARWPL